MVSQGRKVTVTRLQACAELLSVGHVMTGGWHRHRRAQPNVTAYHHVDIVNIRCWHNVVSWLGQRLQSWPNHETTMGQNVMCGYYIHVEVVLTWCRDPRGPIGHCLVCDLYHGARSHPYLQEGGGIWVWGWEVKPQLFSTHMLHLPHWCWPSVANDGTTLKHNRITVLCLLGSWLLYLPISRLFYLHDILIFLCQYKRYWQNI